MNHQTFAQLLGNYGEFFGAIAVLVTLAYLIIQTNVNTKALRATIYNSWVNSRSEALRMMADHPEFFSQVYSDSSRRFRDLDRAEQTFHMAYFTQMMNYNEQTYLHHLDGVIDQHVFDTFRRQLVNQLRSPLHQESWARSAHVIEIFDKRFVEYVENTVLTEVQPTTE